MIFYIILFLIILAIVVWGGVTQWRFIKGKGKDYFDSDHVIIPPVKMDFKNDVAIVGHGAISEEDRKLINKFDTVYRCTTLANWKKGDKITHYLVVTNVPITPEKMQSALMVDGVDGKQLNPNIKFYSEGRPNGIPAIFNKFKDKFEHRPEFSSVGGKFKIGNIEYESCKTLNSRSNCLDSAWGSNFTTGFLIAGLALHNHPKSNIHLFGYSWYGFYLKKGESVHKFYKWRPRPFVLAHFPGPGWDGHISNQDFDLGPYWPRKEGIAIITGCDRCFIHPLHHDKCKPPPEAATAGKPSGEWLDKEGTHLSLCEE